MHFNAIEEGQLVRIVGHCQTDVNLDLKGKLGRVFMVDDEHYDIIVETIHEAYASNADDFWDSFSGDSLEYVECTQEIQAEWLLQNLLR